MSGTDLDPAVVARLGDLCLRLPGVVEENAWQGVRWRVRGRTFAHVLTLRDGKPASYAEAAGIDGPAVVVVVRVTEEDRLLLGELGLPHFAARWGRDIGGLVLEEDTDWGEVAELVTESYLLMAPKGLAAEVLAAGTDTISAPD